MQTIQIAMTSQTYFWIQTTLGYAYDIFLWGMLYYSVFLYLTRSGHYKAPCPKNKERELLFLLSWMLLLWVYATLLIICLKATNP